MAMKGAAMPVATVDEDRYALTRERDIRANTTGSPNTNVKILAESQS